MAFPRQDDRTEVRMRVANDGDERVELCDRRARFDRHLGSAPSDEAVAGLVLTGVPGAYISHMPGAAGPVSERPAFEGKPHHVGPWDCSETYALPVESERILLCSIESMLAVGALAHLGRE